MKELPVIEATYMVLATILDDRLELAQNQGDASQMERITKQQRINDSAYFILAWGQLEAQINEECVKAIVRRKDNSNWEMRRAWDSFDEGRLRMRFEDRVALLLDRADSKSAAYRDTINLYGQRNQVAHGKSLATGIDVPAVISQLYQIASELSP